MKTLVFLLALLLLGTTIVLGQDCTTDGSASSAQLRQSVRSVATNHVVTSSDEKAFNRAGDQMAAAIVQTIPDSEITSPQTLNAVLSMLRAAFACPYRCVAAASDRQPRVTLLLLEHMHNATAGSAQSEIDETKNYVLAAGVEQHAWFHAIEYQDSPAGRSRIGAPPVHALYAPSPEYMKEAREANVKGTVVLEGTLGRDGCLRDVKLVRVLGYGLDESALVAVQRWRFKPLLKNGVPTETKVAGELNFDPAWSPDRSISNEPTCAEK